MGMFVIVPTLRRLPDHVVTFRFIDGRTAAVGAHEIDGYVFFTKVELSDFPYNFPRLEDLKSAILASIDVLAAKQFQDFESV
jgi:hypothetical protein